MTFDMQLIHWQTVAAFAAYLAAIPRPSWCQGLTNHNTYIPNELQWRGVASMNSMRQTYIAKGWTSGPHLYLAAEAPNPADIGVWQMTPITHQGTHAGQCNRDHLGIENVGDFNARPPSPAQYDMLLAVNRALLTRWGLLATDVNVHNECMAGRICPGKYLTGAQIRTDLAAPPVQLPTAYRILGTPVWQRQDCTGPIALYLGPGVVENVDKHYPEGTAHLSSGAGFIKIDQSVEAV